MIDDDSMILLLDVGNSFIKWAWLDSAWPKCARKGLPTLSDADELLHAGEALPTALSEAWKGLEKPEQVWMANVAGNDVLDIINTWVKQHWDCPVRLANSQPQSGKVVNSYTEPSQLGVDRWLGLLAANVAHAGPSAVIDCGSAITVDAIDASGKHLGGLILPGIKMMRDSLYTDTSDINETADAETPAGMLFATNTATGVEIGSLYAVVSYIERVVSDMQKVMGTELSCVLTGGDAEEVQPLLSVALENNPVLVLQGLALAIQREMSV